MQVVSSPQVGILRESGGISGRSWEILSGHIVFFDLDTSWQQRIDAVEDTRLKGNSWAAFRWAQKPKQTKRVEDYLYRKAAEHRWEQSSANDAQVEIIKLIRKVYQSGSSLVNQE